MNIMYEDNIDSEQSLAPVQGLNYHNQTDSYAINELLYQVPMTALSKLEKPIGMTKVKTKETNQKLDQW
jgi:hypothetical protein